MMAGTTSKLAEYSMEKTKRDKFSFSSQSMACGYYSYRVASKPKLHREFYRAVKNLPKIYSPENKNRYTKLINNFGTHYMSKVNVGGSVQSVTSIRQCEASLLGLSAEEVQMCLEVEASVTVGAANLESQVKHCQEDKAKTERKASFSSVFNERSTEIKGGHTTEADLLFSAEKDPSSYKEWLNSLPLFPDTISYSLEPLHELLPTANPARKTLRAAISHYILERALWRNCSEACRTGIKSDSRDSCVCSCHNVANVSPDCCPTLRGTARVIITAVRAVQLWGDHNTATDGYVKMFFDGAHDPSRTPVIYNNNNPRWATTFDLGTVNLSGGKRVRFEVWDEDSKWDDDLLGGCEMELSSGVVEDVCVLQNGRFFYKWEVICAPSLGGPTCTDYKPTPMNQHLEKVYVSRHARPLPRDMLLKMGVFVDPQGFHANRSLSKGNGEPGRF